MKQCPRCNASYSPHLDDCPFCEGQVASEAPAAWIRTRSRKTPRRNVVVTDVEGRPTIDMDSAHDDETVELDARFLAENSAEILNAIHAAMTEFDEPGGGDDPPRSGGFEDDVPTAEVKYLGAHDSEEYDIENLVDPPTPEAIAAILFADGDPAADEDEMLERAFDQLQESSAVGLDAESTDTHIDRIERAAALVEQAKAVARRLPEEMPGHASPNDPPERLEPVELPTPTELDEPVVPPGGVVIGTALTGESVVPDTVERPRDAGDEPAGDVIPAPDHPAEHLPANVAELALAKTSDNGESSRGWVSTFASLGLAICAVWGAATGVALPAVLALAVASAALLALGRR